MHVYKAQKVIRFQVMKAVKKSRYKTAMKFGHSDLLHKVKDQYCNPFTKISDGDHRKV